MNVAQQIILKGQVVHRRNGSRRYSAPDSVIDSDEPEGYWILDTGSELLHDRGMWYLLVPKDKTPKKEAPQELCEKCGESLKPEHIVWLELSTTDGHYYRKLPQGHESQGRFPFGRSCAKRPNG